MLVMSPHRPRLPRRLLKIDVSSAAAVSAIQFAIGRAVAPRHLSRVTRDVRLHAPVELHFAKGFADRQALQA